MPPDPSQPTWVDDPDAAPTARTRLPVVVIGAGPVGLAAAAHLLDRGLEPLVLEAGPQVGANIAQWRHVPFFSPWCLALDPVSVRLLDQAGWIGPDPDALPTGADLLEDYLQPLAALPALASRIRLNTTVVAVARHDLDKVRSPGRDQLPFLVRVRDPHGQLRDLQARAVIDASGTWTQPNPLGASGLPALGEPDAASRIAYGLPDILGADRARYAGRRTVVVGAGHSAATSLLALAELQQQAPETEIVWAVRSATPRPLVGKGNAEADELPARGRLATDLAALVDGGRIELATGFRIHTVEPAGDRVRLLGDQLHSQDLTDATSLRIEADQVIAATGFRPDHTIAAELRLGLEPALESPTALAPLIDPNVHTCGTVPAHGITELAHPEPGYVIVGMKSYGRAPTFLLATGYQQVRSVVAALAGDRAGAAHRDQGPPAAAMCATNRTLLATTHRHRLAASLAEPTGTKALGTAADWSAATCCPQPDRDDQRPADLAARQRPAGTSARLAAGRHPGGDRDHLLRGPDLRLRGVPAAHAARPQLVEDRPHRRLLAGHHPVGGGRDPGRPLAGPPRRPRPHDRRLGRRHRAGARLGTRHRPARLLRHLGRHRRRHGRRPVRARLRGDRQLVPRRRRADPGPCWPSPWWPGSPASSTSRWPAGWSRPEAGATPWWRWRSYSSPSRSCPTPRSPAGGPTTSSANQASNPPRRQPPTDPTAPRWPARCATRRCGGWARGSLPPPWPPPPSLSTWSPTFASSSTPPGFAATWTGLLGAMSVGGRVLVSALGRRWPLALATAAVFALQAVAVVVLTLSSGPAGVVGFVALFGLGVGLISFSRAALVADFYGVAAYASINGVLALTVTIARAAAPGAAAAALRTTSGSYQLVMAAVAVCSILASLAIARAHWLHARHAIPSPG